MKKPVTQAHESTSKNNVENDIQGSETTTSMETSAAVANAENNV